MYIILIAQHYYFYSRCYKFPFAILRKPNDLHNRIISSLFKANIDSKTRDSENRL